MPIYAYRCESCGHSKDVLQKISDAPLSVCPQCGEASFRKQLTAAGFQLKGSGWYVTDFRNGNGGAAAPKSGDGKEGGSPAAEPASKSDASSTSPAVAPAPAAAAAPAAAPAPSSSSSGSGSS